MANRPKRLKYTGQMIPVWNADQTAVIGEQPYEHFPGIPARDMDAADVAALSDEQMETVRLNAAGPSPIYLDPDDKADPRNMTVKELEALAVRRKTDIPAGASKDELAAAVRAAAVASPSPSDVGGESEGDAGGEATGEGGPG